MKDPVTPEAVRTDMAALGAGFLALLVVGILLLWRGIPRQAAGLTSQMVRA